MTKRFDKDDELLDTEKVFSRKEFRTAVGYIATQLRSQINQEVNSQLQQHQPAQPPAKAHTMEWVAVGVSLVMWFASIAYLAGVLGQRVTELENSVSYLRQSTMSRDQLQEKFDGISLRLKALEETENRLLMTK